MHTCECVCVHACVFVFAYERACVSTHGMIFPRDPEDLNLLRYIAYSKINVHLIYRHIMKSIIMSNIVRQDFSFKYPGIINARTFPQS